MLDAIPLEDRAEGLQDLDLKFDKLPIERTLSVMWCIETDHFRFRIIIQDRPLMRRGVFSVDDPLGFVAPAILVGKQLLQELCRENGDWDDPIPDELRPRWEAWMRDLHALEELRTPRLLQTQGIWRSKERRITSFL